MWRKTKFWIVLFSALFLLGGGAFLLLRGADTGSRTARISLDGELYEEIDLMAVALHHPAREWRRSRFYAEWLADVARAGFEVPRGARLYLSLPFRWMRKAYSRLSDVKQKMIGK